MVASVSALTSSGQAASYYESAGEYNADGGQSPSEWQGKGARLGELLDYARLRPLAEASLQGQLL